MNRTDFTFVEADAAAARYRSRDRSDCVMHMASLASPRDYLAHPIETLESGSTATRNMLDLAHGKRASFLLTSTSECYGDPLEHPQKETYWGNVNPVGPRSCYDESKRYAEALTMAYHRVTVSKRQYRAHLQHLRSADAVEGRPCCARLPRSGAAWRAA